MLKTILEPYIKLAALLLLPFAICAYPQEQNASRGSAPAAEYASALSSGLTNPDEVDGGSQATSNAGGGVIYKLGEATALSSHPGGRIFGPLYLEQLDLSSFYQESVNPSGESTHASGGMLTPHFVLEHALRHHGIFALQYNPQVGVINDQLIDNFLNQELGVDFDVPLTPRWTLLAGSHFTYFDNQSVLNPAGLQFDASTSIFFQNRFAHLVGSSLYEDSSVAFTYDVSGRTQITLSPELGATLQKSSANWAVLTRFGGRGQVSHLLTPSLQVSVFYDVARSDSPLIAGQAYSSSSIYHTTGASLNQRIGRSFTVVASLAASLQQQTRGLSLSPTGNLALSKQFHRSSVSAAYSRTRADVLLVSNGGYVDQADLSGSLALTRRSQVSIALGDYRTVGTLHNSQGRRAGASFSYRLFPRVSLVSSFNFLRQTGTNSDFQLGDHHLASIGLSWMLSRASEWGNP